MHRAHRVNVVTPRDATWGQIQGEMVYHKDKWFNRMLTHLTVYTK
jgi:hypothetical protein